MVVRPVAAMAMAKVTLRPCMYPSMTMGCSSAEKASRMAVAPVRMRVSLLI